MRCPNCNSAHAYKFVDRDKTPVTSIHGFKHTKVTRKSAQRSSKFRTRDTNDTKCSRCGFVSTETTALNTETELKSSSTERY